MEIECERCHGSGEIGVKMRGSRETPGPVPDDARGWVAMTCPDCRGKGEIRLDDPEEDDDFDFKL
jgi:DnaJ-class molecular chaperone